MHSMDTEDDSSIITSDVFFKARTGKTAGENVQAVNQKVNVSFINSKLNKGHKVILYHPVEQGVAVFWAAFLLFYVCKDKRYAGQCYWKAITLPSPTAVDLWIHKCSQNAIRNSAFGTEQKATSLMIKTLHFRELTPQREHEN